jgi:hypothetical protein
MTSLDTQSVLEKFPDVKLSYEEFVHKKVYDADIIMAIPQGKKCYVWFTMFEKQYVCYLIELGRQNKVERIHMLPTCFNKPLGFGSVFYGTMYLYNRRQFIVFENVFFYKGRRVAHENFRKKLDIFKDALENEIKNMPNNNIFTTFGLPAFHTNHEDLVKLITPNQRVMYFQYRYFHKHNVQRIKPHIILHPVQEPSIAPNVTNRDPSTHSYGSYNKDKRLEITRNIQPKKLLQKEFEISACLQNDIYMVHGTDPTRDQDIACIPDYATSVMMNRLFRSIKENDNLDTLEESDDEEEFEDDREDKFVDLEKRLRMLCTFHYKFKKWVPVKIV